MSVDPALTSPELAALAGPSVVRSYLVWDTSDSSNVVSTAQVNGTPIFPVSTLQIYNTGSGWSNVAANMTVLIGTTPGGFDKGIYRVRKAGTSSTLELMAVGQNDSGEITIAVRGTGIAANDYITILKRNDVFGAFPRIAYTGIGTDATIYEDWDANVGNFNKTPPPIVNITIAGRPSNYATHVYSNDHATFDIVVTMILWPTSTGVTWAITLPSGVTLNSGSLTGSATPGAGGTATTTINVTVPHSANTYTFAFEAVENNGQPAFALRKVWVKSFTYPPTDIVRIDSDVWDTTGVQMTVTLNSLVGLAPCAMVQVFDMNTWNGTSVPTAADQFSLYVLRQKEITDIGVTNVSFDLVSPSYILDYIGGQSQVMEAVSNPLDWQQVITTLSYLDFIIWWLLAQRVRGLLQNFNYTSFGLTNTQKRMADWRIDTGTLLQQVQQQAIRYAKGNFGCDPSGEIMLRRYPSLVPNSDRSSIPTRTTFNENIYKGASLGLVRRPSVRRVRGEAFYSNLTTTTPVWCDAPSIPTQGKAEEKCDRQIVDNANEIWVLTGNYEAWRNNPYPSGTLSVPKNWAVIKPAQLLREILSIPDYLRYDRVALSAYITITKATRIHNSDGTVDFEYEFHTETLGTPAINVPIPKPDLTTYNSPYQSTPFSPIPPYQSNNPNPAGTSAGPVKVPSTGSVGLTSDSIRAFLATNFIGTPSYRDVTPSDLASFQIKHGLWVVGTNIGLLLASDGTNSAVWVTRNLFAPSPTWTKGAAFSGVYTEISEANASGDIEVYSPDSAAGTTVYDFLTSDYGFTVINVGNWFLGVGWQDTFDGNISRGVQLHKNISSTTLLRLKAYYTITNGAINGVAQNRIGSDLNDSIATQYQPATGSGTLIIDTGPISESPVTQLRYTMLCGISATSGVDPGGSLILTRMEALTGGGGNAEARHSSDFGATIGSAVTVGTPPGPSGGFDVQRNGTVSYAAALNKIRKATTLGGSYSDLIALTSVNALCIVVPWYTRNSLTALNSGSSPEFIYVLDTPDGSGHTVYWVVGGTPVNITPVISGSAGVATSQNCITVWKGKYLAANLLFGSSQHLVTSIDGGSTWIDRGVINTPYMRVRRQSTQPGQLFMAGQDLEYTPNLGVTLVAKTKPVPSTLVFYEPVG